MYTHFNTRITNIYLTQFAGMLVGPGPFTLHRIVHPHMGQYLSNLQLIPQIIINYRRHNAVGLQPTMMMLWAWAGVPLGVYNIVKDFNVALRIQPQILTFLSLVTWIQCFYYERVITNSNQLSLNLC